MSLLEHLLCPACGVPLKVTSVERDELTCPEHGTMSDFTWIKASGARSRGKSLEEVVRVIRANDA